MLSLPPASVSLSMPLMYRDAESLLVSFAFQLEQYYERIAAAQEAGLCCLSLAEAATAAAADWGQQRGWLAFAGGFFASAKDSQLFAAVAHSETLGALELLSIQVCFPHRLQAVHCISHRRSWLLVLLWSAAFLSVVCALMLRDEDFVSCCLCPPHCRVLMLFRANDACCSP